MQVPPFSNVQIEPVVVEIDKLDLVLVEKSAFEPNTMPQEYDFCFFFLTCCQEKKSHISLSCSLWTQPCAKIITDSDNSMYRSPGTSSTARSNSYGFADKVGFSSYSVCGSRLTWLVLPLPT